MTVPGSVTVGGVLQASGDNLMTGNQTFGEGGTVITFSAGTGGTITFVETANLYSSANDTLKTDDSFVIQGDLTAATAIPTSTVKLGEGGTKIVMYADGGGTVTFNEDTTNLYWSAAGVMKTDATLDASTGAVLTKSPGGAIGPATLSSNGEIQFTVTGGTVRMYGRIDGTTYFWDKS